jgi:hypothetical protein
LLVRFFGAVGFLGGLALIVAGILNIVHLHDRAGGTTGIVLGILFMLGGGYLWTLPLASEPPRWRIRSARGPQTSNGGSDVGKHEMNQGGPSIWRKIIVLSILAPIALAAGVIGLLWCTSRETSYCPGTGGLLAVGVFAIIGAIHLYRRRGESGGTDD